MQETRPDSASRAAIVTAGDSGIGKATAVALAAAGHPVGLAWHRDEAGARATASEIERGGGHCSLEQMDLTAGPAAADAIDRLADAIGGIYVLVNNAGTGSSSPFTDLGYEEWRQVLSVDLDGPFLCSQRAARRMIEGGRGGRIVNVTSVHEHVPLQGSAAYCAAKGGLGLLTKVMALELARHGITVNSVAPGEIATPMTGQEDEDPHGTPRPGIPAGRPGDAREVAAVIAHLASPEASYTTGSSYVVDGGLLLMAAEYNRRVGEG
ncbi:MAG TPA: SDR family oxidoreductase [Acidimicrobiales bacterium]|nr:SDR family oxidoreductase [Acidimicrobiales bacterium]